jgi:hypothetical protein
VETPQEQALRQPTIDESLPWGAPGSPSNTPAGRAYQAFCEAKSGSASQRRVTIYDPGPGARPAAENAAAGATPAKSASAARKIVGVLVTYSWSDQGQIFPVLEGRNRIGSDPIQCDIAVPQDDTLSAVNSHIVFRKNFTIGDDVSMGGTDMDGEPVETAFVPLRNYARIRTGSTHWTFIAIEPPAAEAGTGQTEEQ